MDAGNQPRTGNARNGKRRQNLTEDFGEIITENDPYFEDVATLWLIHSKIIARKDLCTAWYLFFNTIEATEFDRDDLPTLLGHEMNKLAGPENYSEKSLEDDCTNIIRMYVKEDLKTKGIKGHDLMALWKKYKEIDYETACSIEMRIRNWFQSDDENLFEKLLDNASNAFEYWRYIYEKQDGSINVNFLRGFRGVLKEVCCKQLFGKSWSEYMANNNI